MSATRKDRPDTASAAASPVCTRHHDRETLISCGRCGRPYCPECLIHTAAGLRCHECAGVSRYMAERAIVTAAWQTVAITAAAGAGAYLLRPMIGLLFLLILAAIAGAVSATRWSSLITRSTRSRMLLFMSLSFGAGAFLGPLVLLSLLVLTRTSGPVGVRVAVVIGGVLSDPLVWLLAAIAAAVAWWRLR